MTYDPLAMVAAYRRSSDITTHRAGDYKLNAMLDEKNEEDNE